MTKKRSTPAMVMVVEDDEALNDAYAMIPGKVGYSVLRTYNGQEALEVLAQHVDAMPT